MQKLGRSKSIEDDATQNQSRFMSDPPLSDTFLPLKIPSVVTTINLETLQRDKEGEPLTTLKTFRQPKGKDSINFTKEKYKTWPMVGMNTVIIKPGKISVGDQIILTPY